MKQKLLLFLMMFSFGTLFAQSDTLRTLVISEIRWDESANCYLELTNMGTEALQLSEFELQNMTPWTNFPDGNEWPTEPPQNEHFTLFLPDTLLQPGDSYVLMSVYDRAVHLYQDDIAHHGFSTRFPYSAQPDLSEIADLEVHRAEGGDERDSASININGQTYDKLFESWSRDALFVRHHPPGGDSCTVDQFNGIFSDPNGTLPDWDPPTIAGVPQAPFTHILVRQFDVKQGNIDFIVGTDLEDSEWIPIPLVNQWGNQWEPNRAIFWTVGNHGDYNVDAATLTSSTIDINWTDHILTVPWGVRNDDDIMLEFDKVPGLAWHYHYAPTYEDSAFVSVRTGDKLTIYAVGNDLDVVTFDIKAAAPNADANIVIPKRKANSVSNNFVFSYSWKSGAPYVVSEGLDMDMISEIPFATRKDTLYKYLEKAPNASWEIVAVDGLERVDLKNGDILRVSAEDGSEKDYLLKLQGIRKNIVADLSAITWPDIPVDYRDIFGWKGDTIPDFNGSKLDYKITIPWDVDGIPALVAKNEDDNASHKIVRAKNLNGALADRTAIITSFAEDDTSTMTYNVILEKEKAFENIQPWEGKPFISQYTFAQNWSNRVLEIVNPGTSELDLSNYMIVTMEENNPGDAIANYDDWYERYQKYIPGYKWQSEAEWTVQRSIAVQDVAINPIVWPGDVFVIADMNEPEEEGNTRYYIEDQIDIDFHLDPFGDGYDGENVCGGWDDINIYLFEILNDSIKLGTKPATDPNDFKLIDMYGNGNGSFPLPIFDAVPELSSWIRKPYVYEGNPVPMGSFGETAEESDWIWQYRRQMSEDGIRNANVLVLAGNGSHFMDDVTVYRSTVNSLVYLLSEGYSLEEEIRGVVTGTTVDDFFGNIILADDDQALKVIALADGSILDVTATVSNGDTLVVISADSVNVSKYILEVTDDGLSDDAVLTSTEYTIGVDGTTGTVAGMEYGTTLKAVVDNVLVPDGASLIAVSKDDAYVPFRRVNFDTIYVDVTVTDQIYFEVVAEDMNTMITYQLKPNVSETDAFVTSDLFMIDQTTLLIGLIPQGTTVKAFFANLVPVTGASIKLYDKLGIERLEGTVSMDDVLLVTAADGVTTKTYYLTLLKTVANYLAYVISDVYVVDQIAFTIDGVLGTQSVADFNGNVSSSEGATMEVHSSDGSAKGDSDLMVDNDILQVTAGNGVNVVTYIISVNPIGIRDLTDSNIRIYPNPSTGQLNIAGAEIGSRISVYNTVGVAVRNLLVYSGIEMISLDDQPDGMFFITVSNKDEVVGHYKVIKQ